MNYRKMCIDILDVVLTNAKPKTYNWIDFIHTAKSTNETTTTL